MSSVYNLFLKKHIVRILVVAFIAKLISLYLLMILPSEGISLSAKNDFMPSYFRYRVGSIIDSELEDGTYDKSDSREVSAYASINSFTLKGIYKRKKGGYVIISASGDKETYIISVGEIFNGYRLVEIGSDSAWFERDEKRYMITLKKDSSPLPKFSISDSNANGIMQIGRSEIQKYSKNFNLLWRDISIKEVKEGKKIVGFKVEKVRDGSALSKIGLQKGDVIIRANGKKLNSYAAALNIYKNISKIESMKLIVKRKNEEVELNYEIL